ncbi:MAG: N-6 DNA methylase, partial [Chloroflexi bacterium]|nr:N-6 DNA methylase [Chloroflexota bacterium]
MISADGRAAARTCPSGAGPATRVVATPRADVDLACRLTLARYLIPRHPALRAELEYVIRAPQQRVESAARGAGAVHHADLHRTLSTLRVVDPACGEGDFLLGMLRLLARVRRWNGRTLGLPDDERTLSRSVVENNLYGVEAQGQALSLARRRLTGGEETHTRLVWGDSLVEREEFAWRSRFPEVQAQGGFDLVIGNPPYVRHELIADPLGRVPREVYKRSARTAVHRSLPTFFGWDEGCGRATHPVDGRADLASLFAFLGFSLLRPGGALGLILPVGMFEALYGRQVLNYLERTGQHGELIENRRQRSFSTKVNTLVFIAHPRHGDEDRMIERIAHDGSLDEANLHVSARRSCAAAGVTHNAAAGPSHLTPGPSPSGGEGRTLDMSQHGSPPSPLAGVLDKEGDGGDNARAHNAVSHPALASRAADPIDTFVRRLLDRLEPRLAPLGDLGRIRYPLKTGINRFFYLDRSAIERFGLGREFCRPVVRSPRQVRRARFDVTEVDTALFVCDRSAEELAAEGRRGALAYIEWGARQRTSGGVFWPQVPSVRGRRNWYATP